MDVKGFFNKNKKIIINIVAAIILGALCFTGGRFIRLRGISESGIGVEQSIDSARLSAEEISAKLDIAERDLRAARDSNDRAIRELNRANEYNSKLRDVINECQSAIEVSQTEFERNIGAINELIGTTDYILQLAEIKAESNELLIERLTELLKSSDGVLGE